MSETTVTTSPSEFRYLVAWGGDRRSQDALKLGAVLARTFNAKLDIVYVVRHQTHTNIISAGDDSFEQQVEKEARAEIKKALKNVDAGIETEAHIAHDDSITQGILRTVKEIGADMIIIGAGASAGQPIAANPIVGGLLHASPVPVAMAPRNYRKSKFDTLTSLTAAVGPRKGAQIVVMEAAEGVSRVGLPLHLISLVDLSDDKNVHIDGFDEAERVLADAAARIADKAKVTTEVGQGRSLRNAVKKMDWNEQTVLMVGSSRLANEHRTFLGTAATRMLSALPVPMIVVPRNF